MGHTLFYKIQIYHNEYIYYYKNNNSYLKKIQPVSYAAHILLDIVTSYLKSLYLIDKGQQSYLDHYHHGTNSWTMTHNL